MFGFDLVLILKENYCFLYNGEGQVILYCWLFPYSLAWVNSTRGWICSSERKGIAITLVSGSIGVILFYWLFGKLTMSIPKGLSHILYDSCISCCADIYDESCSSFYLRIFFWSIDESLFIRLTSLCCFFWYLDSRWLHK